MIGHLLSWFCFYSTMATTVIDLQCFCVHMENVKQYTCTHQCTVKSSSLLQWSNSNGKHFGSARQLSIKILYQYYSRLTTQLANLKIQLRNLQVSLLLLFLDSNLQHITSMDRLLQPGCPTDCLFLPVFFLWYFFFSFFPFFSPSKCTPFVSVRMNQ